MKIFLFVLLSIFPPYSAFAGEADSLFQFDDILHIELRSDFSSIQKDRTENPVYHDSEMIYHTPGSKKKIFSVKVMARGNFRLNPVNCRFPPLFINFKKNEVKNTLFDNQNVLKLVTPCQFDEDVIKEYLIYKMYNQVTKKSFKVRLAKIVYFDTATDTTLFERFSFFIENKDHVAERNNAIAKDKFVTPYDLNTENIKKLSVFQYLIGNKDWYISSRHNIMIIQPIDSKLKPEAVPYDFDFASFINADYTKPKGIPENKLSNRQIYKGPCYSLDEFNEIFNYYRKLRPQLESIIKNMKDLSRKNRAQLRSYIKIFYTVIENDDQIKHEFIDVCETKSDYNILDNLTITPSK